MCIEPYLANAGSSAQKRNLYVVIYTSLIFKIYICTGSYCPAGTKWSMQYECLAGTYNNRTGADDQFDCLPCTGRVMRLLKILIKENKALFNE